MINAKRTTSTSHAALMAIGLILCALLLGGCRFFTAYSVEATELDIQAAFNALAEAYDYALVGQTIVTDVPSTTTYTSADGTVTLKQELTAVENTPWQSITNTYTVKGFTAPVSKIVVSKASYTVYNSKDGWGNAPNDMECEADLDSAGTVYQLRFDVSATNTGWGPGVLYNWYNGAYRQANYKDFSYEYKLPMIP
jgi:hypothetical protein